MKVETAIKRIMAKDMTDRAKWLALGNLALRCFPSSPSQRLAQEARDALGEQIKAAA